MGRNVILLEKLWLGLVGFGFATRLVTLTAEEIEKAAAKPTGEGTAKGTGSWELGTGIGIGIKQAFSNCCVTASF